jgi:transposase-like protein
LEAFTVASKATRHTREFKQQMVDMVRSGRTPASLAKEFEPTSWSISLWVKQHARDQEKGAGGQTSTEREELARLRRQNRKRKVERIFDMQPEVALITLNPGGNGPDLSQGDASCEYGCAYRTEAWGSDPPGRSALQVQVQALLEQLRLRLSPQVPPVDFMDHGVLGGYYIPFRSPSFAKLVSPHKSMEFAQVLWAEIFASWTPRLLVTIDRVGHDGIRSILTGRLSKRIVDTRMFPTGWGNCRAEVTRFVSPGGDATTLVRLPHLSLYKLFSREQCAPRLREIFDYATDG